MVWIDNYGRRGGIGNIFATMVKELIDVQGEMWYFRYSVSVDVSCILQRMVNGRIPVKVCKLWSGVVRKALRASLKAAF